MALTGNDKQWIKETIVESIQGVLEATVMPRFDAVETEMREVKDRLTGVENRLDNVENRLTGVESRLDNVEAEVREVKGRLGEVEHRLCEVEGRLDSVENELEAITNDLKEIYDVIYTKPNRALMSAGFARMSSKEKLLVINEELLKMAKDAGVVLPR